MPSSSRLPGIRREDTDTRPLRANKLLNAMVK
jgi:hypothetical protein